MKKILIALILVIAFMVLGCGSPPADRTYSVLYYANANNVTGFPPNDTNRYTTGMEAIVLDKGELSRSGYVFVHWNTRADGGGSTYTSGDKITIIHTNVFLYAIWE